MLFKSDPSEECRTGSFLTFVLSFVFDRGVCVGVVCNALC